MQLTQRTGWFSSESYEILDDALLIRYKTPSSKGQFTIHFDALAPYPRTVIHKSIRSYAAATIALLAVVATLLFLFLSPSLNEIPNTLYQSRKLADERFFCKFLVGMFSAVSLIAVVIGWCRAYRIMIFDTSSRPLIFRLNKPHPHPFQTFIDDLQRRLKQHRSPRKHLARAIISALRSEDSIDQYAYERALAHFQLERAAAPDSAV